MTKRFLPLLALGAALFLVVSAAAADTVHGFCSTASGCAATTLNGNPTIQFNGTAQFGFYDDGGGTISGNDFLVLLSPTNLGPSITVNETNTGSSTGTADLISSTSLFSSGKLGDYLFSGSKVTPANPFDNYGGPQGIDSTTTGFFVYELSLGNQTLQGQSGDSNNPLFTVTGGLGAGDFALDFICGSSECTGVPNSEVLYSGGTSVPEPGSLSMLCLGLLGLLGLGSKRLGYFAS